MGAWRTKPWEARENGEIFYTPDEPKPDWGGPSWGQIVVTDDGHYPPTKEQAAHIVACHNALAGVPNPEGVPKLFEELKNLNLEEAQYDYWWLGDLCEALKACIETSEEGAKE